MKSYTVYHKREVVNIFAGLIDIFLSSEIIDVDGDELMTADELISTVLIHEKKRSLDIKHFLVVADDQDGAERMLKLVQKTKYARHHNCVCWLLFGNELVGSCLEMVPPWVCETSKRPGLTHEQHLLDRSMPPHMILPHLFLSDFPNVTNRQVLEALGLYRVVNASRYRNCHSEHEMFEYLEVAIDDLDHERIDDHFEALFEFLKVDQPTVVHCQMGVSRSATLVMAYLIKHLRLTLAQAVWLTRSCRNVVFPNAGFLKQLLLFEEQQLGIASVDLSTLNPKTDYLSISMFGVDTRLKSLEPLRATFQIQPSTQLIWRNGVVVGVMRDEREHLFY